MWGCFNHGSLLGKFLWVKKRLRHVFSFLPSSHDSVTTTGNGETLKLWVFGKCEFKYHNCHFLAVCELRKVIYAYQVTFVHLLIEILATLPKHCGRLMSCDTLDYYLVCTAVLWISCSPWLTGGSLCSREGLAPSPLLWFISSFSHFLTHRVKEETDKLLRWGLTDEERHTFNPFGKWQSTESFSTMIYIIKIEERQLGGS